MTNAIPGTCRYCGTPTLHSPDPIECTICYELRSRIEQNPALARRFLTTIDQALLEHAKRRLAVEELFERHAGKRTQIDAVLTRLLEARNSKGFLFVRLVDLFDVNANEEVPLLADVLTTLTGEGCAQRRYSVCIPEHGIEHTYLDLQAIPETYVIADGTEVTVTDAHVHPEYCLTALFAA